MISVSLILEYLYYPLKVYMKMQDYDIKTSTNVNTNISLKHLLVLVKVILEKLLKDVPEFLDIVHQQYKDAAIEDTSAFERLRDDLKFNSWIITIKSQKMLKMESLVLKL